MRIEPGDTVGDSYLVERYLGGGGMGSVYLARDVQLDRQVAIKVLHEDVSLDAEADARFQREAQVMSRVVHPNVVAVYGFGRHLGAWYIAMEFVEGESLEDLLDREDRLSLEQAITITRQVAGGLAEAHVHGIVHRDIKPGNILLRQLASGALLAKVVDFGLARAFEDSGDPSDSVTDRAKILGTPAYMAPEQIQNAPLDGRTDMYALAIVFYQMTTGDLPIYRKTVQGILLAHMVDDPNELLVPGQSRLRSRTLDRVVQQALAKQQEQRFDDIVGFATALERASGLTMGGAAAVACPSCGHMGREGAGFCERCGCAVPLSACPACVAPRYGERYFCASCGTSLLNPSRQAGSEGEGAGRTDRVTAAILVARLQGDLQNPAISDLFASFPPHVEREGGRPLAMLGSECVAAFGLGGMREREMESAIDCALGLHRLFERLRGIHAQATLHIGMSIGLVSTRGLGFAWGTALAMGESLDTARAAAEQAQHGEVLVTNEAWREVRGIYDTSEVASDLVRVKRHREVSHSLRERPAGALNSSFIIRSTELVDLRSLAHRVERTGKLHVAPVLGEGGSGKSRLLGEVMDRLSDTEAQWQIDAARCSAVGLPAAYEPFVEILRARAGGEDAASEDVRNRLAALPGVASSGEGDTEERIESLGRLIGLTAAQTLDLQHARPATAAEQAAAFDAFSGFLKGAAAQGPVLLMIADLQWAKQTTMDLLAHVVRTCDDAPIMLLLPMRAERSEELLQSLGLPLTRTRTIELMPLDAASTRNMVRALLGGVAIPQPLTDRIHGFSQGIPGRVSEAVEALVRRGVFEQKGDRWQLAEVGAVDEALDRGLNEIILSRVGRLPPAERAVLQAAAIAGAYAPRGMINAMLDREVRDDELQPMLKRGFLARVRNAHFAGEAEVSIRQQEIAALLSESVATSYRKQLHARAARWLMDWQGSRPAGFGAMLAHHFMFAGDDRNAAQFLVKTAVDALRAFANRDAYDAFSAAVEVSSEWHKAEPSDELALQTLLEALLGQAEVGVHLGELSTAREAAERAEDLAGDETDASTLRRSRAFIVQGEVATRFGEYPDAVSAFSFAATAADLGPRGRGLAAIATGRKALVLYRSGDVDEAAECARAGLLAYKDAVPTPDVLNGLGRLHTVIGHVASRAGDYAGADASYETGRELHERAGDRIGAAMLALSLGNSAYRSGSLDRAENLYREAAETCARFDYLQGECNARNNLGYVLIDRQDYDAALTELELAEQKMRRSGLRDILPDTLRLIAQCRMERGNADAALKAAREAVRIAEELGADALIKSASDVLQEAEYRAADPGAKTTLIEPPSHG